MNRKTVSKMMLTLFLSTTLILAVGAQQNDGMGEVIYSVPSPVTGGWLPYTHGLAWDGAALWVTGAFDGMIYHFDPFTNTVLQSFHVPTLKLRDLAWDGTNLWVTHWNWPRSVYKLDPNDGSVITSFSPPFSGHPDGLAWDGDYLWIGEQNGKIYRVNASTGQAVYSFSVPLQPDTSNPKGLAWDGEHMWVGYQVTGLIKEHDITTGDVLTAFASPSGGYQQGLAWDGCHLWSTGGDNYIYQIDVRHPCMSATVEIYPETLSLHSLFGRWIKAYIELPEGYDVSDIEISTVTLNNDVPAELHPTKVGDYDNDGIPDLMVKFSRIEAMRSIFRIGENTLRIRGEINELIFEGRVTIRVNNPH